MAGVVIDVAAKTAKAERDLSQINASLMRIDASTKRAADSVRGMFKALALAGTAAVTFNKLGKISTEFTEIGNQIAMVTGRSKDLGATQLALVKIARDTRTPLEQVAKTYGVIGRSTKNLGKSQRDMLAVTRLIQQSIALSGASAESANSAITQLGQGLSSGMLMGQELAAVREQLSVTAQAIAKGVGVDYGKLKKLAESGALTANTTFDALLSQTGDVAKQFEGVEISFRQTISTLGSAVKLWVNGLDQGVGLSKGMADGFTTVADKIFDAAEYSRLIGLDMRASYYQAKLFVKELSRAAELRAKEASRSFLVKAVTKYVLPKSPISEDQGFGVKDAVNQLNSLLGRYQEFSTKVASYLEDPLINAVAVAKEFASIFSSIGSVLFNFTKQFVAGFSRTVYITTTVSGSLRDLGRAVDSFFGGHLQAYKRFSFINVFAVRSDVEKAIFQIKRLSPQYILGAGWDKQTFAEFFSIKTLRAYGDAFSDLAKAVKGNETSLAAMLNRRLMDIRGVFKKLSTFLGLRDDTIIDFKPHSTTAFFKTLNEMVKGIFNVRTFFLDFQEVIVSNFFPTVSTVFVSVMRVFAKFGEMVKVALTLATDALVKFAEFISTLIMPFSIFSSLGDTVQKGMEELSDKFASSPLEAALGKIVGVLLRFMNSVKEAFSRFREIIAPSTELEKFVDFIAKGYSKTIAVSGFKIDISDAVASVSDAMGVVNNALKKFGVNFDFTGFDKLKSASKDLVFSMKRASLGYRAFMNDLKGSGVEYYIEEAKILFARLSLAIQEGVHRLNKVLTPLREFGEAVVRVFFEIYDKVIGHSWWTDTISQVTSDSDSLWDRTVAGLTKFKDGVVSVFKEIHDGSKDLFRKITGVKPENKSTGKFQEVMSSVRLPSLDLSGPMEAIKSIGTAIADVYAQIYASAPFLARAIGALFGAILLNRKVFGTFGKIASAELLASFAVSFAIFADTISGGLFDRGFLHKIGTFAGEVTGVFVQALIAGIPQIFGAVSALLSGFFEGFVQSSPLLGGIFKSIFSVFEQFGLAGPLGLIGGGYAALKYQKAATKKGHLSDDKGKKDSDESFSLFKGALGSISYVATGLAGFVTGNSRGLIKKFQDTVGYVNSLGMVYAALSATGGLDSLFTGSPLAKLVLDLTSLVAIFKGKEVWEIFKTNAVSIAIEPIGHAIRDVLGKFNFGKEILKTLGGPGGIGVKTITVIQTTLDSVITGFTTAVAGFLLPKLAWVAGALFGKNPDKTIAYLKGQFGGLMRDFMLMAKEAGAFISYALKNAIPTRATSPLNSWKKNRKADEIMAGIAGQTVSVFRMERGIAEGAKFGQRPRYYNAAAEDLAIKSGVIDAKGESVGLIGSAYFGAKARMANLHPATSFAIKAAIATAVAATFLAFTSKASAGETGETSESIIDKFQNKWNSINLINPFEFVSKHIEESIFAAIAAIILFRNTSVKTMDYLARKMPRYAGLFEGRALLKSRLASVEPTTLTPSVPPKTFREITLGNNTFGSIRNKFSEGESLSALTVLLRAALVAPFAAVFVALRTALGPLLARVRGTGARGIPDTTVTSDGSRTIMTRSGTREVRRRTRPGYVGPGTTSQMIAATLGGVVGGAIGDSVNRDYGGIVGMIAGSVLFEKALLKFSEIAGRFMVAGRLITLGITSLYTIAVTGLIAAIGGVILYFTSAKGEFLNNVKKLFTFNKGDAGVPKVGLEYERSEEDERLLARLGINTNINDKGIDRNKLSARELKKLDERKAEIDASFAELQDAIDSGEDIKDYVKALAAQYDAAREQAKIITNKQLKDFDVRRELLSARPDDKTGWFGMKFKSSVPDPLAGRVGAGVLSQAEMGLIRDYDTFNKMPGNVSPETAEKLTRTLEELTNKIKEYRARRPDMLTPADKNMAYNEQFISAMTQSYGISSLIRNAANEKARDADRKALNEIVDRFITASSEIGPSIDKDQPILMLSGDTQALMDFAVRAEKLKISRESASNEVEASIASRDIAQYNADVQKYLDSRVAVAESRFSEYLKDRLAGISDAYSQATLDGIPENVLATFLGPIEQIESLKKQIAEATQTNLLRDGTDKIPIEPLKEQLAALVNRLLIDVFRTSGSWTKYEDLASVVSLDPVTIARNFGRKELDRVAMRGLGVLSKETIARMTGDASGVLGAKIEGSNISKEYEVVTRSFNDMLSSITSVASSFDINDILRIGPDAFNDLRRASDALADIERAIANMEGSFNRAKIVEIAKKKAKQLEVIFQRTLSILHATPERINQALSKFGVNDENSQFISAVTKKEFLDLDRRRFELDRKMKEGTISPEDASREAAILARAPKALPKRLELALADQRAEDAAGVTRDTMVSRITSVFSSLGDFATSLASLPASELKALFDSATALSESKMKADYGVAQPLSADALRNADEETLRRVRGMLPQRDKDKIDVEMYSRSGASIDESTYALLGATGRSAIQKDLDLIRNQSLIKESDKATQAERTAAEWAIRNANERITEEIEKQLATKRDFLKTAGEVFASAATDGVVSGMSEVLQGRIGVKDYLKEIVDTFTSAVVDAFVNGLMDPFIGEDSFIMKKLKGLGSSIANVGFSVFEGLTKGTPFERKPKAGDSEGGASEVVSAVAGTKEAILQGTQAQQGFFANLGVILDNSISNIGLMFSGIWKSIGGMFSMSGGGGSGFLGGLLQIGSAVSGFFGGGSAGSGFFGGGSASSVSNTGFSGTALDPSTYTDVSVIDLSKLKSYGGLKFATGGLVNGPGTGTSDSIPAMLSNQEFVVNAKATKDNLGLLTAINSGRVRKFAKGGLVSDPVGIKPYGESGLSAQPSKSNTKPASNVFNITITGDISRQTRREIFAMLPQIATGVNKFNHESGAA